MTYRARPLSRTDVQPHCGRNAACWLQWQYVASARRCRESERNGRTLTFQPLTSTAGPAFADAINVNQNANLNLNTGAALTLSGTISIASGKTLSIGGTSGVGVISGLVQGGGSITSVSPSTFTLSNANSTFSGGTTFASGSTIIFSTSSTGGPNPPTAGPFGTGALTFSGGQIASSTNGLTIGNAMNFGATRNVFLSGGSFTLAGNMDIGSAGATLTTNYGGTQGQTLFTTFSGVISGTGALTKQVNGGNVGGGIIFNNGNSTFSGGYLNTAGFTGIGADSTPTVGTVTKGPLGTGTVTNGEGQWFFNPGTNLQTIGNALVVGAATNPSNTGWDARAGGLNFTGATTLSAAVSRIYLAAGATKDITFSGVVSGTGKSLELWAGSGSSTTGNFVLTNANTYDGTTTIDQGNLVVTASVGATGASPLGNPAGSNVVTIGGTNSGTGVGGLFTTGANLTVARPITVANLGTGAFSIGGLDDNNATFSGLITLARSVSLNSAAVTGANATAFSGQITGAGGITKTGTGLVTLTNAVSASQNNFTGGITVNAGILRPSNVFAVPATNTVGNTLTVTGGTLDLTNIGSTYGVPAISGNTGGTLALGGLALTAGSGNTNTAFAGTITGTAGSSLTKTGSGTLALTGSNSFASTTVTSTGVLEAPVYGSNTPIGAGTLNLGGGSIFRAGSFVNNFGGVGNGWNVNNSVISSTPITSDVLTLTDNGGNEARTAFFKQAVPVSGSFNANFTYTPSGAKVADGVAFILQNSAAGASALGGAGGGFAYSGITSSIGVELNIYSGAAGGIGTALGLNGSIPTNTAVTPVSLGGGNPINVQLIYNAPTTTLTEILTDPTASTTKTTVLSTTLNLATQLGGTTGFVGFGGATGGSAATQAISNFSFAANNIANYNVPVVVGTSSTIDVPLGGAASFGALTINGTSQALSITNGTAYFASTANGGTTPSITLGTGSNIGYNQSTTNTFAVPMSGTGGLIVNGSGQLNIGAANTYSGGTTLSSGTLALTSSTTTTTGSITNGPLGTGTITITGGTLNDGGGARTIANAVSMSGNVTFAGSGSFTFDKQTLTTPNTFALAGNTVLTVSNTATINDVVTGASSSLGKSGSGTLILGGNNTYAGGTTVSTGTLLATNAAGTSATGTGSVTVNSGAILGGTGTIAPTGANITTILSGGKLDPHIGAVPSQLTVNNGLTFNSGAFLDFLLNSNTTATNGPATFDNVSGLKAGVANGILTFGAGFETLNLTGAYTGTQAGSTYHLFSGFSSVVGAGNLILGSHASNPTANFNLTATASGIDLTVFSVTAWTGAASGPSPAVGTWDTSTANWTGGTLSKFTAGDAVRFDDVSNPSNTTNVQVATGTSVTPASIVVAGARNYTLDSTLASANGIAGA